MAIFSIHIFWKSERQKNAYGYTACPRAGDGRKQRDIPLRRSKGFTGLPAAEGEAPVKPKVSVAKAVTVEHHESEGAKITRVSILTNQNKFSALQEALDNLGVTGITVTNVFGYGAQKGHPLYFRGSPVSSRLLPKVKIDIAVCKIPVETLVKTVQDTLYTGNYGDGKVFIYDVEDVIKIRTGERGYDALQDEDTSDS